jgi:hypothetical protein
MEVLWNAQRKAHRHCQPWCQLARRGIAANDRAMHRCHRHMVEVGVQIVRHCHSQQTGREKKQNFRKCQFGENDWVKKRKEKKKKTKTTKHSVRQR